MKYYHVKFFLYGNVGEEYLYADSATDAIQRVTNMFKNANIVSCTQVAR